MLGRDQRWASLNEEGQRLLLISPSRKPEKIQSPYGRQRAGSEDQCGESKWQELRSESKTYCVAEKKMFVLIGSVGLKA